MANRNFTSSKNFSMHVMPVTIDLNVAIGSTGAVGALSGNGVASVTRLAVGTYRIQLQDNYAGLLAVDARMQAPVTGSNVAATALTPGVVYQITALGTTTTAGWIVAGLPAGIAPAVGAVFLAAATSTGNGTAKAIGVSGISNIEIVGATNTMLAISPQTPQLGGMITIQCVGPTDATTTTMIPKDPASGSVLYAKILLSNSSIQ